ncbi:MAG: hypothetical protein V4490_03205 [Pseudomonadota bacterium]
MPTNTKTFDLNLSNADYEGIAKSFAKAFSKALKLRPDQTLTDDQKEKFEQSLTQLSQYMIRYAQEQDQKLVAGQTNFTSVARNYTKAIVDATNNVLNATANRPGFEQSPFFQDIGAAPKPKSTNQNDAMNQAENAVKDELKYQLAMVPSFKAAMKMAPPMGGGRKPKEEPTPVRVPRLSMGG